MNSFNSTQSVSIIICTRNRAEALRQTLQTFHQLKIPERWAVELLVVDNGSTDHTAEVANSANFRDIVRRYIYEAKAGQSNARNTGLAHANGDLILFIDDDVAAGSDWLGYLAGCLARRECDAVVGKVELANCLRRSWMKPVHKLYLAAPDETCIRELEMIGANMGFHRTVLDRVPLFDPELGPGALGFGDDSLFSFQVCHAGFRLREVPDAKVVHHLEPDRLLRSSWLSAAQKRGRVKAYLLHHWEHREIKNPNMLSWYFAAKLRLRRLLQPPVAMNAEGCEPWEMSYAGNIEMCRQFLKERKRPRNYTKRGLVRLDARVSSASDRTAQVSQVATR